jgi:ketosteroid isomerase-like protein
MKIFLLTFLLVLSVGAVFGQLTNSKCQPLIDAEHAFTAMAKEKNTRDAFITFLSDSAITFDKAGPRMGKRHLTDQKPNESLLSWDACYTDVAASGDWGFNIGPWEYRPNKTDANPVAFGHFVTVWAKEKDGKWLAFLDIGISHPKQEKSDPLINSNIQTKHGDSAPVTAEPFAIEKNFINELNINFFDTYAKALSTEARLLRNGIFPLQASEATASYLRETQSKITYKIIGGGLSPVKDMMFVYGTASVLTVKNGQPSTEQVNYLRIWKKENGSEWKLVVDLLS